MVTMAIQVIYHNTGLVPDNEIFEKANKSGLFETEWSSNNLHVKLYPKQFSGVKVQILRGTANVWLKDKNQLSKIEDLLNKTFRVGGKIKPFKQPRFVLMPGEQRKILETPLGLLSTFMYYYGHEIADSVYCILQSMDSLDR